MNSGRLPRESTFTAIVAGAMVLIVLGCKPAFPPSKPLAELNSQEASGYSIFQSHCAGCHYADRQGSLHGPGLQGLYKQPYLPSGAPANDDRVTNVILHGRNMMPALGNTLDEQQLNDLIAYLHTLRAMRKQRDDGRKHNRRA